jgi:hypothetical protein
VYATYFYSLKEARLEGFEDLAVVVEKSPIFRNMTQCNPLNVNRLFGGTVVILCACSVLSLLFSPEDEHDMFL